MPRKRSPNGSGTIYKRRDGSWEVKYSAGYDPGSGKLIRRSKYFSNEQDAAKALRSITSQVDNNTYIEPSAMPLKTWLKVWLEEYTASVKPGTVITYESNVRLHIVPALGALKLSEIRTHDIQSFINQLHRGSKALSPKMVKNIHGTLHKALDVASKIEYIRGNPANYIELPRIEREEIKPLAGDQIVAFTQTIKATPCEALFYTALYSGMRLSELLGLQWRCVDFDTGTIRIDKQLLMKRSKDTKRELGPTKNGKTRTIKVAPAVINVLKSVKKKQAEDKLKAGPLWNNEMDLVFTDELGKCIPHATVEHRFKRIVAGIGLSDRRPHDLRHTYATESIRLGVPIKTISEALGHYSTAFTMDVYAHVTPEMQDDAATRMQAEIDRRNGQLS